MRSKIGGVMKNKTHSKLIVRHQDKIRVETLDRYIALAMVVLILLSTSIIFQATNLIIERTF